MKQPVNLQYTEKKMIFYKVQGLKRGLNPFLEQGLKRGIRFVLVFKVLKSTKAISSAPFDCHNATETIVGSSLSK